MKLTDTTGNTPLLALDNFAADYRRDPAGQTGIPQSAGQRQMPDRGIDDRCRHRRRPDHPDHDDHRADQRQHRSRPGLRLRQPPPPPDPDDAREHEHRAAQAASAPRRRTGADAGGTGDEGGDRRGRTAAGGDAGRLDAGPVRQPGQPGRPPPHDCRGNLAGQRRHASMSSSPASAPAARSPASRRY